MFNLFSGLGNLFNGLFQGVGGGAPQAPAQAAPQQDSLFDLFYVRPDLQQKYGASYTPPQEAAYQPQDQPMDALQAAITAPFTAPAEPQLTEQPKLVREGMRAPVPQLVREGRAQETAAEFVAPTGPENTVASPMGEAPPAPRTSRPEFADLAHHRAEEARPVVSPDVLPEAPPPEVLRPIDARPLTMAERVQLKTGPQIASPTYKLGASNIAAAQKAAFKVIEDYTPTSAARLNIFRKGGIVVNLDTNWANGDKPTRPMVVIPDNATTAQRSAAEAYAKEISTLYKQQFGVELKPKVVTRGENGRGRPATIHTEPYAVTDSKAVAFFNTPEGAKAHADILKRTLGTIPGVHFSIPHNPGRGDLGAHGNGTNEVALARLVMAALKGD